MTVYAHVVDNTIQSVGGLPTAARRLDTRQWVLGLRDADPTFQQACGYLPVTDVPRPADTATTTWDRSVELVAGTPTVVWTERPMTPTEQANVTANTNRTTIQDQATAALATNRTFLAIVTPTNAQNAAQIKALTRQNQGLIRLQLNQLDSTD